MEYLAELGLGKAIDATEKQPWASKKAYQAREVSRREDLLVTNESNRYESFSEDVETHYEVQGAIEAAIKVPNKPIETSVAADLQRSQTYIKEISGEYITTRTISFQMNNLLPCSTKASSVDECGSTLEENLRKWVIEEHCQKCGQESENTSNSENKESTSRYKCDTNAHCRDFLVDVLGGATHYVSSVTLGTMRYKTKTISSTQMCTTNHTAVSIPRGASTKMSLSLSTKNRLEREDTEEIGIFPSEGKKHSVDLHTPAEALIRYAFTPLTALVSNSELRKYLQQAIQQ